MKIKEDKYDEIKGGLQYNKLSGTKLKKKMNRTKRVKKNKQYEGRENIYKASKCKKCEEGQMIYETKWSNE